MRLKYIVNIPHKYETRRKIVAGSMKNETLAILLKFFQEPNRKLAEMLHDSKYLWLDVKRQYKSRKNIPQFNVRFNESGLMDKKQRKENTKHIQNQKLKKRWEKLRNQQANFMHAKNKDMEKARMQDISDRENFIEDQKQQQIELEKQSISAKQRQYNEEQKHKMEMMGLDMIDSATSMNKISPVDKDTNKPLLQNKKMEKKQNAKTKKNENGNRPRSTNKDTGKQFKKRKT